MFDEVSLTTLALWGAAAAFVGCALAFLPQGRIRFSLITAWTLMPLWLMLLVIVGLGPSKWVVAVGIAYVIIALPVWGVLSLLPFNLVRRTREIYGRGL